MTTDEKVIQRINNILTLTKGMRQAMIKGQDEMNIEAARKSQKLAEKYGKQIDKLFREIELLKPEWK